MSKTIKTITLIASLLFSTIISSCGNDDGPSCLIPPCGTVNANATNLTIRIDNNLNVTNAGIVIDENEQTLSLNGLNFGEQKYYTCWQTIPDISSSSMVVFIFELNGETELFALNVTHLTSNELVITIGSNNDLSISDYQECSN
jgi:hypothetical protein